MALEHLDLEQDFPDQALFDVMVTFHDDRQQPKSPFPGCKALYTWSQGSKCKIMTESVALSAQTVLLRTEYDTDCFTQRKIALLQPLIVVALQALMSVGDYDKIKQHLEAVEVDTLTKDGSRVEKSVDVFGSRLDCLSL